MLLLYILFRICMNNKVGEKWYYYLLKASMLYFLIPLPLLKLLYTKLICNICDGRDYSLRSYYNQDEMILFINEKEFVFNDAAKMQNLIGCMWIAGALLTGGILIVSYLRRRKRLKRLNVKQRMERDAYLRESLLERYKIHTKIRYENLEERHSPFTIGFIRPIVFYDFSMSDADKDMLLAHELIHVKRKDMFWRLGAILTVAMHWFNPLAWMFKREFERVCEYSCDEWVLQNEDMKARYKYAGMLLEYQVKEKGESLAVSLSKGGVEIERRMKKILEKTNKIPTMVAATLIGILVVLNSVTVFAYEDLNIAKGDAVMEESFFENDFGFIPDGEDFIWEIPEYEQGYVLYYDTQFVDESGNVYEVKEGVETNAVCAHEYISGVLQQHVKNGDGGCTVYYYNALRCSKCGMISNKELLGSSYQAKCPH